MDEARQRRAKAMADAEKARVSPDEVRAMEGALGQQGWSNGQRLRDLIDMLEGVPVRTRPDVWPSYSTWSMPDDETDNRVCHVSVEALAEAMRMRRIERDGSPCWSTAEARELLEEAMRCELELIAGNHRMDAGNTRQAGARSPSCSESVRTVAMQCVQCAPIRDRT